MPIDPNDPQQVGTPDAAVSNTPTASQPQAATPAPSATPDATPAPVQQPSPALGSASPTQSSQTPQNGQPTASQPGNGNQQTGTVSNATSVHSSVQRASVFRQMALALAGGPRFKETIDPNTGQTQRSQIPLSKGDIGMALAFEAISGALGGLAQRGPGAEGRAAEAGFQQVSQQTKDAQQQQEAQAQAEAQQKSNALARRAQIAETNSRTLLNTSEAEQQGADAIDKLTAINRQSGVLDVDPSSLDNAGQPMTQDELLDAMKAGKLSSTDQLGPVAGRVEVTNPDGSKRWEATHLVVRDPNTPVTLTQDDWNRYAAEAVPGYPAGTKIGQGVQVPLRVKQSANEIVAAHYLANQRLTDLRNTLDGTPAAKLVPESIDFTKPGVQTAVQRFQKYVSHNATNLNDPFQALQQMGADRRDPKTGEMQPNPDAKYVSTVADAFGGWSLLETAHNQIEANKKAAADFAVIDSEAKANAVLASPKQFSQAQVSSARNFLQLTDQQGAKKAAQDARARAVAEGTDVQAMYRFGKNPVTGEVLGLNNAPPSMLVDPNGNVIPQDMTATYKPTAQQRQTADTARQVIAISQGLQAQIAQNPALIGPLAGRSKEGLAKLGIGDAQAQKMLDDVSLLQSATTKMHTGRFSDAILKKTGDLIKPSMNVDQFAGAISSIQEVANRYANEDRLVTVADWKAQQPNQPQQQPQQGTRQTQTPASAPRQVTIPAGAVPGRDAQGNIVAYRLPSGQIVQVQ
jgi:hypothetical protein